MPENTPTTEGNVIEANACLPSGRQQQSRCICRETRMSESRDYRPNRFRRWPTVPAQLPARSMLGIAENFVHDIRKIERIEVRPRRRRHRLQFTASRIGRRPVPPADSFSLTLPCAASSQTRAPLVLFTHQFAERMFIQSAHAVPFTPAFSGGHHGQPIDKFQFPIGTLPGRIPRGLRSLCCHVKNGKKQAQSTSGQ